MQVAIPEFDGRLITVPFSFKEPGAGRHPGLPRPTRSAPPGSPGSRCGTRALRPEAQRGQADRASCSPATRPSTRASATRSASTRRPPRSALLTAMRAAGLRRSGRSREDGDALIHRLIAAGGARRGVADRGAAGRGRRAGPARRVRGLVRRAARRPARDGARAVGRSRPGSCTWTATTIVLAGLLFGNVFADDPAAARLRREPDRHLPRPDLPPTHHYLAAYRWLRARLRRRRRGAPRQARQRSSGCPARAWACRPRAAPDAMLGDLPLVYPFIVNDPGEGTQAKRRAHAVDRRPPDPADDPRRHLRRPGQARAAARRVLPVQALDPAKTPTLRGADLGAGPAGAAAPRPAPGGDAAATDEFDDFVLHVDGYLCEIKDAQIRDGLHVLGRAPEGDAAGQSTCWRDLVRATTAGVRPAMHWRRCRRACAGRSRPAAGLTADAATGRPRRRTSTCARGRGAVAWSSALDARPTGTRRGRRIIGRGGAEP